MTTTYQSEGDIVASSKGRPRRAPAVALAVGTVLCASALAMHLRGGVADVEFVRRVEASPDAWLTGHVMMGVGGILLLLGLTAVPRLVRGRGRRAVTVGTTLAAVGSVSSALGDVTHGALAYVLVGEVDAEQSLHIQERLFTQPLLAAVSMPAMLLPLGMLVLGGALLYSRAVPTPLAVLLLVAPIAVQLGYMVTALPMPLMVLPLVAGMGWLALIVARSPQAGR
jgi:hypothetical protein